MEPTQSNVEAMIKSVYANKEIIDSMLKRTVENEKIINSRLSARSSSKAALESEQIDMYREYVRGKEDIKSSLDEYRQTLEENYSHISIELYRKDRDYSAVHSFLDKINTLQIKIMEMLCGILGLSNRLVGCI